jgi:hypothetical protein|nr:MAG TPA: hypothetical protein [Caudoviricetes sp.]
MREAQKKYEKKPEVRERYFKVYLKLHKTNDAEIIKQLQKVPKKSTYIKNLIQNDISKQGE